MKVVAILFVILISVGCNNKNEHTGSNKTPSSQHENSGNIIFKKLLKAFNQSAKDVIALFDSEANVEFPYASSLGTSSKLSLIQYYNYLKGGLSKMPVIHFEKIKLYQVDENTYWAEVHGSAQIPSTGKLYQQDYVMYFTLKDGKINFYKEYWNPVPALRAFGDHQTIKETFNTNN